MSDSEYVGQADLEAYEQQMLRDLDERLPKKGDRLFAQTDSAVRLDPLGYSDPFQPANRSLIGRRGFYSDGFLEAADRLVDGFSAQDVLTAPGAPLIYPILLLYRHHLELQLKGLLSYSLTCISQMDEAAVREKVAGHSLKSLWNSLQSHCPDCNKGASTESQKAFRDLLFEWTITICTEKQLDMKLTVTESRH